MNNVRVISSVLTTCLAGALLATTAQGSMAAGHQAAAPKCATAKVKVAGPNTARVTPAAAKKAKQIYAAAKTCNTAALLKIAAADRTRFTDADTKKSAKVFLSSKAHTTSVLKTLAAKPARSGKAYTWRLGTEYDAMPTVTISAAGKWQSADVYKLGGDVK